MIAAQHQFLTRLILQAYADRPKESVASWCERSLAFDEPDNRGPFTLAGREFIREPLDAWGNPLISDQVLVFGSQSGKTASIMGGAAWTIRNDPARLFWVMPTRDLVRSFSRTRLMPMYRASPALAELIPSGGQRRHDFATLQQHLGPAIVDLVWSNSPSMLSSVPARVVVLDEVEKFNKGGGSEADAVSLAAQRTKNFASPKRVYTSTPALLDGLIWREFHKTDQRRRFVPCPHCRKKMVFAWSRDYTVFPITGREAFITWDKEAKRADKSWDLDRVERSARAQCPHCGGHILDGQKSAMDRDGEWEPSASAARGYRGWHLPSLYACGPETSFGRLAVRFLNAVGSLEGVQGFINGDLAEPLENQGARGERLELVSPPDAPAIEGAVPILTVDHQELAPQFWFVVRAWKEGHSRLVDFGPLDDWEAVRKKQLEHKVQDHQVTIDSGHDAEHVYENCVRWAKRVQRPGRTPLNVGWLPSKGDPGDRSWKDKVTGQARPFTIGEAALPHQRFELPLLLFNPNYVKDIFERLRRGKTRFRWEVTNQADDEYFRHLDAEYRKPEFSRRTRRIRYIWVKRSRDWPDHLRDCELMQLVMAMFHKLIPLAFEERPEPPKS